MKIKAREHTRHIFEMKWAVSLFLVRGNAEKLIKILYEYINGKQPSEIKKAEMIAKKLRRELNLIDLENQKIRGKK